MFGFLPQFSCLLKKAVNSSQPVSLCVLCVCFVSSSGCLLDQQRVWFSWVCSTVICTARLVLNAVSLETHTALGTGTLAAHTCQLLRGDTHLTLRHILAGLQLTKKFKKRLVWAACLIESITSAVSARTLKPLWYLGYLK